MNEIDKKQRIKKEVSDFIYSLPLKEIEIKGKLVRGFFDETKERFYLVDENGELTNKMAHIHASSFADNDDNTEDNADNDGQNIREDAQSREDEEAEDHESSNDNTQSSDKNQINKKIISRDELERIYNLPRKEFRYGSKKFIGLYDEENHILYEVNNQGNLTGSMVHVSREKKEEQVYNPQVSKDDSYSPANSDYIDIDDEDYDIDEEEDEENEDSAYKTKKLAIGAALVAGIILILFGLIYMGVKPYLNQYGESDEPVATEVSQDAEGGKEVSVIQAVNTLIPGDVIKEDDIQVVNVSNDTYTLYSQNDNNIYTGERLEDLVEMYVQEYIPSGEYLTYTNVDSTSPVPKNPWTETYEGYTYKKVAVDPETINSLDLSFGDIVNIVVKKRTVDSAGGSDQARTAEVEGAKLESTSEESYIVDTYSVDGLVVCDMLNGDGESIFDQYYVYSKIPAGEQMSYMKEAVAQNSSMVDTLTPYYVVFCLTDEQATAFGDMSSSDTGSSTVQISSTDTHDISSPTKDEINAKTKVLRNVLTDIFSSTGSN